MSLVRASLKLTY